MTLVVDTTAAAVTTATVTSTAATSTTVAELMSTRDRTRLPAGPILKCRHKQTPYDCSILLAVKRPLQWPL